MGSSALRVAVVGAGANGGSVGADLIEAGADVTLIEQWPEHVQAMRTDGLTIRLPDRELHVEPRALHVCEVAELRHPFDVVLLMMKAYDTRWAAELIAPLVAEGGVLAAVQNGMTTDAASVRGRRAVGTVIEVSSTLLGPGTVRRHTPPDSSWFAVDADPRADRVAALLASAGRVERIGDIDSAKWMKLVSNCSLLATTALLGMPMLDARDLPGMRDLMIAASSEALAVGRARGHAVLPIFGLVAADLDEPDAVAATLLDAVYGFVRPGAITTVLQDWRASRRSETEDLNGLVVAEGARLGIPTPVNERIAGLARRVERGDLQPGPANAAALTT